MGISTKFLIALTLLDHCCSILYDQYTLPLEKEKICSGGYTQKKLDVLLDKAIIVNFKVTPENDPRSDFLCILQLKAPPKHGIVAVVQSMSLRKDYREINCTDYIQFRQSEESTLENFLKINVMKRTKWEPQICGEIERRTEPENLPLNSLTKANHSFMIDPSNDIMEVKLFVSRKKLKDEVVFFQIAFTAFLDCHNDTVDGLFGLCSPNLCIRKSYFDDDVVNCPYVKCVDEKCSPFNENLSSGKGLSAVIVSAGVLSVVVSFLLVLGCCMICRYLDICWGIAESNRRDRGTELSQVEPTAPPPDSLMPSPDKDLPPAYETLFPER